MKQAKKDKTSPPAVPKTVKVRYVKGTHFRVIQADGIFGGITPQGQIQLGIYSERFPLLTEQEFNVLPNGSLGPEIKKGPQVASIERELEASAVLRPEVAKALLTWLQGHLANLEAFQNKMKES